MSSRKTNFYTPTKVALSFRMNPRFLSQDEYPQPLYGMFMVVGSEFRGFHLVSLNASFVNLDQSSDYLAAFP